MIQPVGGAIVISDGGGYIAFQSNGEQVHRAKFGGEPPFNADGNNEIFRLRGRRKVWQLTDTTGCQNTVPSLRDDGTAITFRSTCNLIPGKNPNNRPQVFLYKEVFSDHPLAGAGCQVAQGCCNEANGCYQPIFGRKHSTRPKDCIAKPRSGCNAPEI